MKRCMKGIKSYEASQIHWDNNYIEPSSKTQTVRKKRIYSVTEYSCFLTQFSFNVTQNLLYRAILKTSKLKE